MRVCIKSSYFVDKLYLTSTLYMGFKATRAGQLFLFLWWWERILSIWIRWWLQITSTFEQPFHISRKSEVDYTSAVFPQNKPITNLSDTKKSLFWKKSPSTTTPKTQQLLVKTSLVQIPEMVTCWVIWKVPEPVSENLGIPCSQYFSVFGNSCAVHCTDSSLVWDSHVNIYNDFW